MGILKKFSGFFTHRPVKSKQADERRARMDDDLKFRVKSRGN